ncbi:MAG: cell division protein ZapE [Hyphomicrobiaceae bacterium]
MKTGVLESYHALAATGEIEADPAQALAAERLDTLSRALSEYRPGNGGLLGRLLRKKVEAPNGLYIHGAVGRGKTMLMDLFHSNVAFPSKRRVHFHAFMADVHERIAVARRSVEGDPLPRVAESLARDVKLLCFDELHVTDIADAMILGRLFTGLLQGGVVVVATSNAHPRDLYRNGLNRQLFLPFIDLLERHLDVVELVAAKDYRLEKLAGRPLYFTPADARAHSEMRVLFQRLTGRDAGAPCELEVKGRTVPVPEAAMGVARFSFDDLCDQPLGALDYLHIAHAFHTVMIEDIPILSPARRNAARRFINLIDTLYDNSVSLVASAAAEPHELYPKGDGADLFERTASRLIEMRSQTYLERRKRHNEPVAQSLGET